MLALQLNNIIKRLSSKNQKSTLDQTFTESRRKISKYIPLAAMSKKTLLPILDNVLEKKRLEEKEAEAKEGRICLSIVKEEEKKTGRKRRTWAYIYTKSGVEYVAKADLGKKREKNTAQYTL